MVGMGVVGDQRRRRRRMGRMSWRWRGSGGGAVVLQRLVLECRVEG
jgi:hypothetical protein